MMVPVENYYEAGLLSYRVCQSIVDSGKSLLLSQDGVGIIREASIGHTVAKFMQLCSVKPYSETHGVYNFVIGDGGARLNSLVEMVTSQIQLGKAKGMITVILLQNSEWLIEDVIIPSSLPGHQLHNNLLYDALSSIPKVELSKNNSQLEENLGMRQQEIDSYIVCNNNEDIEKAFHKREHEVESYIAGRNICHNLIFCIWFLITR